MKKWLSTGMMVALGATTWLHGPDAEAVNRSGFLIHPTEARGDGPERVFDEQRWSSLVSTLEESVDLFNGNLRLALPLGLAYPVNPTFSYQLVLHYNSTGWEREPVGESRLHEAELGIGWDLSFGRLLAPSMTGTLNRWVFVNPNGSAHAFYSTASGSEAGAVTSLGFSRDSTYLRLRQVNATTMVVEDPNGLVREFQQNAVGAWVATELRDARGGWVEIVDEGSKVTVSDSTGRIHTLLFTADPTAPSAAARVLSSASLSAFGGSQAAYTFTYAALSITPPGGGLSRSVPHLTAVNFPGGARYELVYGAEGRLASVKLPTKGTVEWTYTPYSYVASGCPSTLPTPLRSRDGVGSRRLLDPTGLPSGQWQFVPSLASSCLPELSTSVVTPGLDQAVTRFSVATDASTAAGHPGSPSSFGLVGGTAALGASLASSGSVLECNSQGQSCTTLVHDLSQIAVQIPPSGWLEVGGRNSRTIARRTEYPTDLVAGLPRYSASLWSGYAGWGLFTHEEHGSNFGGDSDYEVVDRVLEASANGTSPLWRAPAVLFETVGNGLEARSVEFCRDAAGDTTRERHYLQAGAAGAHDVLVEQVALPNGEISRRWHGGDLQNLPAGPLCALTLPVPQYEQRAVRAFGRTRQSWWVDAQGGRIGAMLVDLDIDASTGLPSARRDEAGVTTALTYDALGRLVWELPPTGAGPWVEHRYQLATGTTLTGGERYRLLNHKNGGGLRLAQIQTVYDGFGRPGLEREEIPGNVFTDKGLGWNAAGQLVRSSDYGAPNGPFRLFSGHDALGRTRQIDGPTAQREADIVWLGASRRATTTPTAYAYLASQDAALEGPVTTTELFDARGRVWQSTVEERVATGAVVTKVTRTYRNLRGDVTHTTVGGIEQPGRRTYDGLGRLIAVTGSPGATYSRFDALGNATREQRPPAYSGAPPIDLARVLDRAGRLVRIAPFTDPNNGLVEFEYAEQNDGDNLKAGKLEKQRRNIDFNGLHQLVATATVEDRFEYRNPGARLTRHELVMTDSANRYEAFADSYTYDELGEVAEITLPASMPGSWVDLHRTRKVSFQRSAGEVLSIAGQLNGVAEGWVSSVTYGANGAVASIAYANGGTLTTSFNAAEPRQVASQTLSGLHNQFNQPLTFQSGTYRYASSGSPVKIGTTWLLPEQVSFLPPVQPIPPGGGGNPCSLGWRDELGAQIVFGDSQCVPGVFLYRNAVGAVVKREAYANGERTFMLSDAFGKTSVSHRESIAGIQLLGTWEETVDQFQHGDASLTGTVSRTAPAQRSFTVSLGMATQSADSNGLVIE